ncbi:MAG: lamin tail domain-containing protein [Verrucomicrobia bacterium]|nr:lamin tail domain-containing protein [Verrucomicrobiota bacterium]
MKIGLRLFCLALTSSLFQWDGELIAVESDLTPPRIASIEPAPGVVERLTNVVVTFTEPVAGVSASDLFLGSRAATAVQGSAARYMFTFDQADSGAVELRWDADTLITDLASPPNRFDPVTAGTWPYEIVDRTPPAVAEVTPRPGVTVRSLTQVEVRFSEPVEGVDSLDLLVNGAAATRVVGESAGPYRFEFAPPAAGLVRFSWSANHGIHDRANPANAFSGVDWSITLNPNFTPPSVRINEFLASNIASNGLKDEEGELQDWIEIYNQSTAAVNLEGWSLTDDREDPGRWVFPAISLGPAQYLVVFASAKDRKPTASGATLHTNFKLNPAGEYLALFNQESPRIAVSEFAPSFPEQRNDYSYGSDSAGQSRYFRTATPGGANGTSSVEGVVPPPHVNVARGWFDAPLTLHITSPLSGVTFRYTTDGSEPTESNGQTYSTPLRIASTTTLRVAGVKANLLPSTVSTHTYLFADDVLRQPNNPTGYPTTWGTHNTGFANRIVPADYEMDPEILNNPAYRGLMKDALLALPVMSIVCRRDDLFGAASGIYTHPLTRGPSWERPCSVEFIPNDGSRGFQVRAGVQIQGNAAREPQKQPKHPLRLVFKGDYGPTRLDFPIFPDSPVRSFDTLVLRADFNFSWLHWDPNQRLRGQRTRDAWNKDTMRAMGGLASHNRYVHLFLNGLYWGIYDPSERPDGAFAASYLGGEKEQYDVVNEGAVVDGSMAAYNTMRAISNLADPAAYTRMQQYLDLTQFIDYMLLHFYIGHQDWGQNKNWYTVRPKDGRRGFAYVPWDGENILDNPTYNRVSNSDTPSGLHTKLVANAEYRLAFADRVQKHFFNNGALTPAAVMERWRKRAREVELPIVAESARWGDYRRDVHPYQSGPYFLYTRDNQWRAEQNRLLSQYFPQRTATVLAQLRTAGLYPTVAAPAFTPFGGRVKRGASLSLSAPEGTIYFTLDESDPRVTMTGAVAASATPYATPIALNKSVRIKARVLRQGAWSALTEADFQVDEIGTPLRITEVMYHPLGGDAFEFVEIQNRGSVAMDVTGFSFTGIEFVFPHRTVLNPGQIVILASSLSPASFAARYSSAIVSGYFDGALGNGSERIELHDRDGRTVTAVTYRDDGAWPGTADGEGFSLEVIDADGDPDDPANWFASNTANGSPGQLGTPPILGSIRLSEISAQSAIQSSTTNADADWIELVNAAAAPASIGGWTVTDHSDRPFVFPAGTVIPPNSFLVTRCDGLTNAAGLHAPFKLDQDGETVALYDSARRRVDAVTFGSQARAFTMSRVGPAASWNLSIPTPGAANVAAELAPSTNLKINEWLVNPRPGADDWLELHNPDSSRPAALNGLLLETGNARYRIQSLTFVSPGGFVRLYADERAGAGHLGFKLSAAGGFIALLDSAGNEIDRVNYAAQTEGVSEGRLPDGRSSIISFSGTASPGQSNALIGRQGVVLNEILASAANGAGWIELFNAQASAVDLSGFAISLESDGGKAWTFPAGSRIGASEHLVIGFDPARPASLSAAPQLQSGRTLSATGGALYLRDGTGRVVDAVEFGMQIAALSIGQSDGVWRLLATPTPGKINAPDAELGSPNSLRINEWLSSPAGGEDWVELFNTDTRPVVMAGLCLTDDPSIAGKSQFQIAPLSFIAARGWAAWKAAGAPGQGPDHVNFNLDPLGEALRLYTASGTLIDAVDFGFQEPGISEGRLTDGGAEIGPLRSGPTFGASNTAPAPNRDADGDGLPDDWEIAHGTSPAGADANADPDRDGLTNLQEYLSGTNPTDPNSGLKVLRVILAGDTVSLEFQAVSNRTYSVQYKQSLTDTSWSKLTEVPARASTRVETVRDSSSGTGARFYRLVTPAQP